MEKILSGSRSGSGFSIVEGEFPNKAHSYILNKTTPGGIRSRRAVELQLTYRPIISGNLKLVPVPIYSIDTSDSYVNISMPYLQGTTGADFASKGSASLAFSLAELLNLHLFRNIMASIDTELSLDLIIEKVDDIRLRTSEDFDQQINRSISEVRSIFAMSSTVLYPKGPCHGDLTLSNIIATSSEEFYVFDFLPSFISSPLLDLAKWEQESIHGWSFRNLSNTLRNSGLLFAKTCTPLLACAYLTKHFFQAYRILSILNILRILPYVTSSSDREWASTRLDYELHRSFS